MAKPKHVNMDYTSGKPVSPAVIKTMLPYMKVFYGNPSSIHSFGEKPREALEKARMKVAELINAEDKDSIVFTSGATESNNMAIKGVALRNMTRGRHIVTSSIEHMSVLNSCKFMMTQGFKVSFLPVDQQGMVDLERLEEELSDQTILVSIMYANGEIGTVQPIKKISQIVHAKNIYLHVDAASANGKVPIDVNNEGVDLLTISSNDMYGPKGVGALYIRKGTRVQPLIHGGGQEKGLRSGTEDLPGIVGLGKAAEISREGISVENERLKNLRDQLAKSLVDSVPASFLNGHPTQRLPDNVAVRFSFIEGESILLSLNMMGVAASSGSACTAKTLAPSHVLRAIGLKHEEAHGSILFTLAKHNTMEDVKYVLSIMPSIVKRLRAMSPLTPKELAG